MACAARLAVKLRMFSTANERRLNRLIAGSGLPVSLNGRRFKTSKILHAMQRDKKKRAGVLRFVLPARIGKVIVRKDISLPRVRKIILEAGGK